jgi:hypothetical protein
MPSLTSAQKDTREFEFENLPDELSEWISKNRDEDNDRKFKPEYLPQSIALGPDGMFCVVCKEESSFSSNFKESLPALARMLNAATEAKSTAGIVSLSPLEEAQHVLTEYFRAVYCAQSMLRLRNQNHAELTRSLDALLCFVHGEWWLLGPCSKKGV